MIIRNPRQFSRSLAIGVALGVLVAAVVSLCFELGNGRFVAGVGSAGGYLLIYGFPLIIVAGVAATTALVLGRFIGTGITAAVAVCLLLTLITSSYSGSQPISRFRRLIWEAAPKALTIDQHEMQKSLSDGTTYTFVFRSNPGIISDLCHAAQLSKVSARPRLLALYFPATTFPDDTDFYRGEHIALANIPSANKALVVHSPSWTW